MDARAVTTLLVYVASVVEKADEQVLPAVYFFAGTSWGASPSQLGKITLCRALVQVQRRPIPIRGKGYCRVQAVAAPLSGVYGDQYDRISVIALGCVIWGVMTSAIALSGTVGQVSQAPVTQLPLRIVQAMLCAAVNGLGLALVIPCSQSIIADFYVPTSRGRAFGMMQLVSAAGVVAGAMFATNLGHYSLLGMDGWRFALHVVAAISVLTGILVWMYGKDLRSGRTEIDDSYDDPEAAGLLEQKSPSPSSADRVRLIWSYSVWVDLLSIISIPSFGIIILQGVIGTLPWNAMVFFTLWLQLLGFSDFVASLLVSTFTVGCAFGGILGGYVADTLATRFPDSGRVMAAQMSCLFGFPLFYVLFKILPSLHVYGMALLYGCTFLVLGSLISWCGNACNAPMFSELVPRSLYSKIFAFDRSFEGSVASMAAPLVGYVAEHSFGFAGAIGEEEENPGSNASALGDSLFACITIPLLLCCLSYSGLYWTFPKDRRRAKDEL